MARTFVALILVQLLQAYCFRSDRRSVLQRPFANPWLNLAVIWELLLLLLIVHVPILQRPFGTISLQPSEWAALIGASATIVPVLELAKWMARRGWLGEMS